MSATAVQPGGQPVKFAGVPVDLAGQVFILPPLNLGSLKRHAPLIKDVTNRPLEEQLECTGTLVFEALRRNYPDVSKEQVDDAIDMGNFQHLMEVTMSVSGMERVKVAPAEVGNVAAQPVTTGPASTPTSPPASGTAGQTSTS